MKEQHAISRVSRPVVVLICMTAYLGCSAPVQRKASPPTDTRLHTKTIVVNGTTLTYTEHGEATPVVLVHGALGDYRTWDGQVGPFSEQHRVFSYSRRGYYPNEFREDGPATSNSIHVEDLEAFIQAEDLGPLHLIGHSGGGLIALFYARDNPGQLISLTLGEAAAVGLLGTTPEGTALLEDFRDTIWDPSREAFVANDDEEGVRRFIDGVGGKGHGFDNLPASVRANVMDNARTLRIELLSGISDPPFSCEDASQISTPTLLLHGESSPRMFVAINDILESCLPNVHRAMMSGVSHGLQMEDPVAFNETVLGFLAQQ